MEPLFDLEPAAVALQAVATAITDDQLDNPTPCAEMQVRTLVAHVIGFTEAFRLGATKEAVGRSAPRNSTVGAELPEDWRIRIPAQLKALVAAWREPAAWDGDTEVGGVIQPAVQMAHFALDEIVIHGWDLARGTGQSYVPARADLAVLLKMLREVPTEGTPGLFGPVVQVPVDAPIVDRVIGLTGRDPAWGAVS